MKKISPEDVLFAQRLRALAGGASLVERGSGAAPVVSPRKSSLGRVIDVRWTLPVLDQNSRPLVPPLGPTRFGRVEWMPDEPSQLDEEDWLVQAQPLDVLAPDRAMQRVFVTTEDQEPFIPATTGPLSLNPAAWWPADNRPGETVCDIAGSPFWLIVEGGPEAGTLQRIPIPIVGCSVAVRGRNVAASIEYDPGFAAVGNVFTPLEAPVLTQGAGRILVTITKSQPVARYVADQTRRVRFRFPATTPIDGIGVVWVPKFATRLISPSQFDGTETGNWLDQTGRSIYVSSPSFNPGIPDGAVAFARFPGDYDNIRQPMVFEVFS